MAKKPTKSIISNEHYCLVCGTPISLHRHHIFYGTANRKLSEQYGLWVYLCGRHHNMSNEGVHFNKKLDASLKMLGVKAFKREYPELDFVKIFGRSYE